MEKHIRRRPLTAFVLSFLTQGLGQFYNGQLRKAMLFYLLAWLIAVLLSFYNLYFSFYGLVSFVAISLAYTLFVMIEASSSARRLHIIKAKQYNKWYFYLLIILINTFLINPLLKPFVFPLKPYRLPTESMTPTLMRGDRIFVNENYYANRNPQRGDVVIFSYPSDPQKNTIKRIIGLSGETIEIIEKKVYLNGKPLEEPYIMSTPEGRVSLAETNFAAVTIPQGKLFVLGDNRDNSQDSRFFGFVDIATLKGKALYIYWAKDKKRIGSDIN